ncbi:hypothetical protein [Rhizobium sp. Root482]|uniref:hypothetical protein n=1 Tax=Rhizobium sp. Root482 TaxID=1736543 RepID=UPI0006FA4AC9|nr:hypothetical protein [Rhizobium sp. Root482]KQY14407.1 hypothetical protein ASD31_09060 [Rhizobium sp. Root482]
MKRATRYIASVTLLGVVLFYLTYVGAFNKDTYEAVASYKTSAINAVVTNLQLPCDRLMNVGMGDYCHVYFEDGFSVRISPIEGDIWQYQNQAEMTCAHKAAEFKKSIEHAPAWQQRAMVRDRVEIRCILTSDAT